MSILKRIRKEYAKYVINKWHENFDIPSKKRIFFYHNNSDRIYTKEFSETLDKACVRRRADMNSVCVDLYWYIKRSRKEHHIHTIHYRIDWEQVRSKIRYVERHELPRVLYYVLKENNKK